MQQTQQHPERRTHQVEGVESTAAIAGHPLHPMFVAFPIGLLSSAIATDVAYAVTGRRFWAMASKWLVSGGLLSGLWAAIFGATDFLTISRARSHPAGWIHAGGNVLAVALTAVSAGLRMRNPEGAVRPAGLVLSALVGTILTVTGWFGGELSYRHGIGVVGHEES